MSIAIDANIFLKYLNPKLDDFINAEEMLFGVLAALETTKPPYYIPTPVLSEILIYMDKGKADKLLVEIQSSDVFRIIPFDLKSAIELTNLSRAAIEKGDKREGSKEPYQKIKLDRQIVAICKAHRIKTLYTEDKAMTGFATSNGISVKTPS